MQLKPRLTAVSRIQPVTEVRARRLSDFFNPGALDGEAYLVSDEEKCDACNGTGFSEVRQPSEPGRQNLSGAVQEVRRQGADQEAAWGHRRRRRQSVLRRRVRRNRNLPSLSSGSSGQTLFIRVDYDALCSDK